MFIEFPREAVGIVDLPREYSNNEGNDKQEPKKIEHSVAGEPDEGNQSKDA